MPSIVVTFFPSTADSGSRHEKVGWPSTWIVHARHSVAPHPNFVPVIPRLSRSTHNTGVSGGASTERVLPFSASVIMGAWSLSRCHESLRFLRQNSLREDLGHAARLAWRDGSTHRSLRGEARHRACARVRRVPGDRGPDHG